MPVLFALESTHEKQKNSFRMTRNYENKNVRKKEYHFEIHRKLYYCLFINILIILYMLLL